jgi:hypothetical protein
LKFHGIDAIGKILVQRVSTLPTWTSADEGRVLYDLTSKGLYYGSDSQWESSLVLTDTDDNKLYRLYVYKGNLQIQEIVI